MNAAPDIVVAGSINLDLVARVARLPGPGETVGGADLTRHPGGKGANQALAAARLGGRVSLMGRVGRDVDADAALALLRAEGVALDCLTSDPGAPTGLALIAVDAAGENQIVVAPGANARFAPADLDLGRIAAADALMCQLESPLETVMAAAAAARGLVCLNLAPALAVPDALIARAGLVIVNQSEAEAYGDRLAEAGILVARTLGAAGAVVTRGGDELARAAAPAIDPVDTTGAGDAFCGALCVGLAGGLPLAAALELACAAGAAAATRAGAQPSLPRAADLDRLTGGQWPWPAVLPARLMET